LIAQYPQEESLIRAYRARWTEMVPHAYDDIVAILRGLIDRGFEITMLTNFNDDNFAEARALYPFLDSGRGVTVSAEVRLLKPDRAIYDCHATTFGLDPAAALFIDDTQANVDGAIAAGWNAVAFQGAERPKTDLTAFGVAI
jgi:2-haloacid dehalogenase